MNASHPTNSIRKSGYNSRKFTSLILFVLVGLTACGGGDDDDPAPLSTPFARGEFPPNSQYRNHCPSPRPGSSDVRGTNTDEKYWLRSWTNELYLWYSEVTDRNPAGSETVLEYFDLMITTATTPSGSDKDNFHFSLPTPEWLALSQSGSSSGYGATFAIIQGSPPREVRVAYTEPGSPAASNNLQRGAYIIEVDGVSVENGNADILNEVLFPEDPGEVHSFTVQDVGSVTTRSFNMTSATVTSDPVQNVGVVPGTDNDVGYILFNDHIATAEPQLIQAFEDLLVANDGMQPVTDLILDIRYNGGGFLDIASELAYMIAGNMPTQGQAFEELRFNDKYPTTNPVTGQPLTPTPFHSVTQGIDSSVAPNQPLPTLNLNRVFVLTGPGTCSASESIMNSLRGVDVEVIQIGATTCGKPYGFYPTDNCGTTYFSIQFQGVNAKDFGDYPDGFTPQNVSNPIGVTVPGCGVFDDFDHSLGDPAEARLAAALQYRLNATCPTLSASFAPNQATSLIAPKVSDPVVIKPEALGGKAMRF